MLDPDFARQQEAVFEDDWKHARQITLQAWENRPFMEKIGGKLADLIGAQL